MRVFSGIRPSGRLHLGNYLGAIKNWIVLQEQYECIFAIVDYHAITTPFNSEDLHKNVREVALDYLSVGLNPKKAALIVQSYVPEHLELSWIFQSISPVSWFERVPTYKEKAAVHPDYVNLGLLAYPALMAADILIYKADLVPVGEDQIPHIELTNMIGKRFNRMFGRQQQGVGRGLVPRRGRGPQYQSEARYVAQQATALQSDGESFFLSVKPLLTKAPRIMSLKDPRKKMSKTGDEGIALSDTPQEVTAKIKKAVTDSGVEIMARKDKPALTNLLTIYSEVSGKPINALEKKYKGRGYGDFKKDLAEAVAKFLEPIQKRRSALERKKGYVERVLKDGSARARKSAQKTLLEVKKQMGLV